MLTEKQLLNLENTSPKRALVLLRKFEKAGYSFTLVDTPDFVKHRGEFGVEVEIYKIMDFGDYDGVAPIFIAKAYFSPDDTERPELDEDGDPFFPEKLIAGTPRYRAYLAAIRIAYEHHIGKREAYV